MRSRFRSFQAYFFTVLVCASFSAGADLKSARRAYDQDDFATAVKQFSSLAEQGNADAQLMVGKMYMLGQGVEKDLSQAMKWLKASATQGNPEAEFFLGSMYLLPQKDIGEGVKWLRLSAEQGMQDAQYLLGKAYVTGTKELSPDPVQADMWLRLAAKDNKDFYQNELQGAETQMSADQIAKGKELAAAWKPKSSL